MADDAQVILQVLAGDIEAYRLLVERYQRPIMCLARHLLHDAHAAEDIAQEAFLAAYRNLGDFGEGRCAFSTWLFTIARHRCLNVLRRKAPRTVDALPERADAQGPADRAQEAELFEEMDRRLAELPIEQRSAFVQAELLGLSCEEIARIEAVPAGTVRSRVSRARTALQAAIRQFVGGDR